MSDGFAYLDIIFFAMVAAFIAFRLRNVLGRRIGHERRRTERVPGAPPRANDKVVALPERGTPAATEEPAIADVADDGIKSGLTAIRLADPSFDLERFLQGSRAAFGMILDAFAKGDRAALRPLLADSVLREFSQAIDERERSGQGPASELVAIRAAEVTGAEMRASRARITVRFVSEQINVPPPAGGASTGGPPKPITDVVDVWTFERDTRSRDPNWELVETGTPA